jgi:dihydrolipoamide dehydrogenase
MMSGNKFDVVVIGSGPGGYVCAIRCAQLGLKTAIVEKSDVLGGTCLNIGCIPSKALLHSTELFREARHGIDHGLKFDNLQPDVERLMQRKGKVVDQLRKGVETLVSKRGISVFNGLASFENPGEITITTANDKTSVNADNFVIATGSIPASLPFLQPDGERILTSTEALALKSIPGSLAVIGAGAIGLEMGSVWSRLGTDVTFIEFLPTIAAGSDIDVSRLAERIFKKQGMKFHTSTQLKACDDSGDSLRLTAEKKGKPLELEADKVLLSVGRKPFTDGLGLEKAGIETDQRGRVPVKEFRTSVKGIYAIGDVIEGPMLAHKAEEEGVAVAEMIAGRQSHYQADRIRAVIYTDPEIASVGISEEALKQSGRTYRTGSFPLVANGRAIAQSSTDGMVKILADSETDQILGASIIARGASEMISSIVAHMEYGGSAEDLAGTIHAHPTISESIKEAALAVGDKAIHIL